MQPLLCEIRRHSLIFMLFVPAIAPLVLLPSHATESVMARTGAAAGGLLKATFETPKE